MKLITQIIASERFFCEAVDFIDFCLFVCFHVFFYIHIFQWANRNCLFGTATTDYVLYEDKIKLKKGMSVVCMTQRI